jgi:PAS domain S-box-containing protein
VPHSLTDLVGLKASAEDFLAAVLETAAQPIWVVDRHGVIRFANPAAIAALGYDSADELFGRDSHETIHYRHPDGTPYPAEECPMLLPQAMGETVRSDLDWFFRRDGSMFPVSYVSVPIEMPEGRGAVVAFTDIEDRLRAERVLREHDAVLAAREGALQRIAALVAGGAASPEVFAAIAREVAQVLGMALVVIWRYEPDHPATVVGAWADRPHPFKAGTTWPVEEHTVAVLLPEIGRPTRIEDFGEFGGMIPDAIAQIGIRSGTGAAIVVDGEYWGVMGAGVAESESLLDHIEDRLADFTELVATAISNTASRDELARLAGEQAALRRVATLVARGVPPPDVFAAVAREVGLLLGVDATHMARYELDGTATGVAAWSLAGDHKPVGTRVNTEGESIVGIVLRTGRPARMHSYEDASGPAAALGRELGLRSSVGAPIVVDQRLWGVMIVSSKDDQPLPARTESRIAAFTELVATAISNTEAREEVAASREEVAASRARIVAATDDERRRVVRDLHDGAQQRLVHTIITLKLARRAFESQKADAPALLSEALDHAEQATAELRELAHGILPAVLTQGGLRAGVNALASRMPVPVQTDVSVDRLPAAVEATAYFVVAEALTNVAKHARARRAAVTARVEDGILRVRVRDDGVGGSPRPDGSGLVGLADRLAAFDGRLRVESPTDGGTLLAADIPLPR